jgi:hypothetical protein
MGVFMSYGTVMWHLSKESAMMQAVVVIEGYDKGV